MLSDNTLQLMVYLISIAAHEGGNRGEPERVTIYARFNKVYKVQLLEKRFVFKNEVKQKLSVSRLLSYSLPIVSSCPT